MELWPVLPTDQLVRSKNVAIIMKKKKKKHIKILRTTKPQDLQERSKMMGDFSAV